MTSVEPLYLNSFIRLGLVTVLVLVAVLQATAQTDSTEKAKPAEWFRKLNIRGYAQLRYNNLLETNPDLGCEQCDKSWGGDNGFFFRRIRVVLYGQVHPRVYIYIQPDFASSVSGSNNIAQIRDAYFDVGLNDDNTFRVRIGQSKIPYSFENMQSSRDRLPLDRNDALNSATSNERDLGIFGYWAPKTIRQRFKFLVDSGLKGSGDYGVVGIGLYNGQTANRSDENSTPTTVARITYPFLVGKQFIEPGLQAYTGKTVVTTVSENVKGINSRFEYTDSRVAASLIVYPQPFGLNAEYNIGTGPEYNPATHVIEQKRLHGGYVLASYRVKHGEQVLTPFVRYQYYHGGKKHELDARSYTVNDVEVGAEWQPIKAFEFVATYTMSQRRYEDGQNPHNRQEGNLLRLQFQVNF